MLSPVFLRFSPHSPRRRFGLLVQRTGKITTALRSKYDSPIYLDYRESSVSLPLGPFPTIYNIFDRRKIRLTHSEKKKKQNRYEISKDLSTFTFLSKSNRSYRSLHRKGTRSRSIAMNSYKSRDKISRDNLVKCVLDRENCIIGPRFISLSPGERDGKMEKRDEGTMTQLETNFRRIL